MDDKKIKFLPFHAINEFMLDDYRNEVVSIVFTRFDELSPERKAAITGLVKRIVKVPGFRNSAQAPVYAKVRASIKPFQTSAEYAANILSAWCELHPELRQSIVDLLVSRGWEILPVEADRVRLPGFLTTWKKDESFEVINQAYHEQYPDTTCKDYDISLMAVWLSGRLPVDVE